MSKQFSEILHEWAAVFMHRSFRDFKRFMDESGLSPSQVNVLMRLYHTGGCGVSDIGDHAGVTHAAASQLVDRLVQQGLLGRVEDSADRRVKQITITPKGRALIEAGVDARQSWMEELTTALTPEQQEMIARSLTMLTEAALNLENSQGS
jgi:DNA-binding MarR family transcriptional regulator